MGLKAILLVLSAVQICRASMECYSCKDALDPVACNTTTICSEGQACFRNSTTSGQTQVSSLGCADYQQCGAQGNIQSSIVGRDISSRETGSCFECCSTDMCNRNLCNHLKPSACTDDESIDCAKMSTLFRICSDIDHAKTVCPKFCGLCNVVDGSWSGWSSWSQCDVTCEKGTQSRTRLCNNPAPKNGGQKCQGSNVTTKPCVREVCPVDGGWSAWEAWKSCSTTCDMGLQSRTRNCSNPFPAHNGQHCFGHNLDVRQCLPGPCANGGWSNWGNWSPCTATCGNGIRSTSRSCTKPPPSPYGQYCIGEHFKMESCAEMECDLSHCQPDPCEHGSCLDLLHDFSCSCNKGFEGRYCNISTSACKSNPCVHGTCYDGEHDYVCVCNDGYRGRQCSISIDYCLSSPCIRGTCINNDTNFTCVCPPGVTGVNCERIPASDCYDILKLNPGSRSGIYWVQLWKTHQYIEVLCDLETAGGGWTVFQRRFNGSVDFGENFVNYTKGFGNKNGEFWLDSKVIVFILAAVNYGASLECYKCTSVLDLASCDTTERCPDGQVCFYNSTISDGNQVTNLGCGSSQQCDVVNNVQSLEGMAMKTRASCLEFCCTDKCNKKLCQHFTPSTCTDEESVDCPMLNTFFNICTDMSKAKALCPKFCGLCYAIDGKWSNWSKWSHCDVTCGNGTQTRTRLCNNPSPKNGGIECLGNGISTKSCFRELCPVDGGWSPWEGWVSCSTSCDIGLQSRQRNCSNPVPERNGHHCFGKNFDVRQCTPGPCANGGWSEWGNWSPCTVTCGIGIRSTSRSCTRPPPSPYGQYCIGESLHLELCSNPECDVCLPSPCVRGTCIDRGCECEPGVTGPLCDTVPASDCYDILKLNLGNRSGIYWVNTWKTQEYIEVLCDLETAGGGWTVFQRRFNGSVDFGRNFVNYKNGFGNKNGEFWLGLHYIYEMASQNRSELRLDLMSADQTEVYEVYPDFYLSPGPAFTLHIGRGTGTAGNSSYGLSYHNSDDFYTYDHDNRYSCASHLGHAGWWFYNCATVNLNGQYVTPGTKHPKDERAGIIFYDFQKGKSLKRTRMMFRRT